MSSYKILKNAFGGKGCHEVLENNILVTICESNYPTGEVRDIELGEPISSEELAEIVNTRIPSRVEDSKLVYGEPDFLPFAFLGRGLRVGAAVCRLVRRYPVEKTGEVLDIILSNRYSTTEVTQLLDIQDAEFWKGYIWAAEAIEADPAYREKLREIIKDKQLAVGSGFLVGNDYLLTNYHVLHDQSVLEEFVVQFAYERDSLDERPHPIECSFDASFSPIYSSSLDYCLLRIKPLKRVIREGKQVYIDESVKQYPFPFSSIGETLGWLQMSSEKDMVAPPVTNKQLENESFERKLVPQVFEKLKYSNLTGEAINIIQHPKGREKEIVIYNNRVQEIYSDFIQYETDAEPGSSGSPLLNSLWQLVGLHHSALLDLKEGKIAGYLGTRIHSIVEDLRKQSADNSDLVAFLRDYVDKPRKGRIFIVGGLTRDINNGDEETNQMKALRKSIFELLQEDADKYGYETYQFPSTDEPVDQEAAINWLNKQGYRVGDVALELFMNSYSIDSTDPNLKAETVRGASVYYVRSNIERKAHAELLMQSLQKGLAEQLPNRGVKSDNSVSIKNGLPFCRKVNMPSLVLYVGFLTSPEDLQLISENNRLSPHDNRIALGIKEGLVRWMMNLSPLYAEIKMSTIATKIRGASV